MKVEPGRCCGWLVDSEVEGERKRRNSRGKGKKEKKKKSCEETCADYYLCWEGRTLHGGARQTDRQTEGFVGLSIFHAFYVLCTCSFSSRFYPLSLRRFTGF